MYTISHPSSSYSLSSRGSKMQQQVHDIHKEMAIQESAMTAMYPLKTPVMVSANNPVMTE